MTTLCCCKRGIWSAGVLCSAFHAWDSCFLKFDNKMLRVLRAALLLSPGAWFPVRSRIWQSRYHTGTACFAPLYRDLSKCFIMKIKPDPLFHRWEKPGPGSVSNERWPESRSQFGYVSRLALRSGAWQRAAGDGTTTCCSQVLPGSASQNPEGSGAVAEPSPPWTRGVWLLVLEPAAVVWAPLLRAPGAGSVGSSSRVQNSASGAGPLRNLTQENRVERWLLLVVPHLALSAGLLVFVSTATTSVQAAVS